MELFRFRSGFWTCSLIRMRVELRKARKKWFVETLVLSSYVKNKKDFSKKSINFKLKENIMFSKKWSTKFVQAYTTSSFWYFRWHFQEFDSHMNRFQFPNENTIDVKNRRNSTTFFESLYYVFTLSDFTILSNLNDDCLLANHVPTNKKVILKRHLFYDTPMMREVAVLKNLNKNSNVIQLYGYGRAFPHRYIVLEYMEFDVERLCYLLYTAKIQFPENFFKNIMVTILSVLTEFHGKEFSMINFHLKSLLINRNGCIKLSRFEYANTSYSFDFIYSTYCYQPYYPLEFFSSNNSNNSEYERQRSSLVLRCSDIWSFGITLLNILEYDQTRIGENKVSQFL